MSTRPDRPLFLRVPARPVVTTRWSLLGLRRADGGYQPAQDQCTACQAWHADVYTGVSCEDFWVGHWRTVHPELLAAATRRARLAEMDEAERDAARTGPRLTRERRTRF